MKTKVVLILGLVMLPTVGFAVENVLSKQVEYFTQSVDGVQSICGSEFTFSYKDQLYNDLFNGAHLYIEFFGAPGKFFTLVKLTVAEFKEGPFGKPTVFPVNDVYLQWGNTSLKIIRTECQVNDGTFCGGVTYPNAANVALALSMAGIENNPEVFLSFNRHMGEIDYTLPLKDEFEEKDDLRQHLKRLSDHAKCMAYIMDRAIKQQ